MGLVRIDKISGRDRTSNRVIDKCSHVPPPNTLSVWRRMELDCSNDRGLNFPIPIRRNYKNIPRNLFLLDADFIISHEHEYKKEGDEKKKTLRLVPAALGGEDLRLLPG